ncbi:MAG TPA: TatD family hydrolase [Firmicutes bacterium]|nr:TatD family hydrolase [Bacillota bacterium]
MLFDTHAHLDDKSFDKDRDELIEEIRGSGVTNIMDIGADIESSKKALSIAKKYDFIYAAVGVHPSDVSGMTDADLDVIRELAKDEKVKAIGEIGLDYHYDDADREAQKKWFVKQLELADELGLPVVIHDRDSKGDCINILRDMKVKNAVMHCFSGSAETARQLVKMGLMISFTGVLTFKNARRAVEACREIPLERLMIETDCPYMAPEPHRGERNHSGYVRFVAEKMAAVKGVSYDEICRITYENGRRFFNI